MFWLNTNHDRHKHFRTIEGVAKLQFWTKFALVPLVRAHRKLPILSRICQFTMRSNQGHNHQILPPKRVLQLPLLGCGLKPAKTSAG